MRFDTRHRCTDLLTTSEADWNYVVELGAQAPMCVRVYGWSSDRHHQLAHKHWGSCALKHRAALHVYQRQSQRSDNGSFRSQRPLTSGICWRQGHVARARNINSPTDDGQLIESPPDNDKYCKHMQCRTVGRMLLQRLPSHFFNVHWCRRMCCDEGRFVQ